jgi:hypothetical protein
MTKYLDYLSIAIKQFMAAKEKEFVVGKLDRLSREFLDWTVVRCQSDEPLHIQEIVMHTNIASPATTHKSISTLYEEGTWGINFPLIINDLRPQKTTSSKEVAQCQAQDLAKCLV